MDFVAVLVCAFDTRCGVCCRYLCLLASDGRCSMVGVGFVAILILILSRRWSLGAVMVYLSMDCRWFDLMRFVVLIGCGGSAMV